MAVAACAAAWWAVQAQQPVIKRIYVTDTPSQDSVFELGNTIALEVTGLNRWLKLQKALLLTQGFDPQKAHDKARDLVLYIDDAPILKMPPLALYVDESSADGAMTAAARRTARDLAAGADSASTEAQLTLLRQNRAGLRRPDIYHATPQANGLQHPPQSD